MKRTSIIALCCAAGLAGIAIGALGAIRFGSSMADHAILTRSEADLAIDAQVLQHIQSGEKSRATELLQVELDGALVTIDAFASRGSRLHPKTYDLLKRVRELRVTSGYRPSHALVASAVERAFALSAEVHPTVP